MNSVVLDTPTNFPSFETLYKQGQQQYSGISHACQLRKTEDLPKVGVFWECEQYSTFMVQTCEATIECGGLGELH